MASAASELDSILDSLHALQMDLDECLQQREPAPRPPSASPASATAAAAPADVPGETPDYFPPPPPPEELILHPPLAPPTSLSEPLPPPPSLSEPPPPPPSLSEPPPPPPSLSEPPPPPPSLSEPPPPACLSPDATAASISEVTSNDSGIQDSPLANRRSLECKQPPPPTTESADGPTSDGAKASKGGPQRVTWSVLAAATDLDGRVALGGPRPHGGFRQQKSLDAERDRPASTEAPPIETAVATTVATVPAEAVQPESPPSKPETKQERKAREEREKRARKELLERQRKDSKRAGSGAKKLPTLQTSASVDCEPTFPRAVDAESLTKLSTTDGDDSALPSLMSVTRPQQQAVAEKKQPPSPLKQAAPVAPADGQQQPMTAAGSFFKPSMQERIRVMDELFNKAYLTRMAVRIHCLDRTTKMLALDERSKSGLVCTLMANKNLVDRQINHAIMEKLPDMKMERIVEDYELLGDTLLAWPTNSKNLLFFEERDEKFGALTNPGVYLGDAYARVHGETAQQLLSRVYSDLFEGEGSVPPMKEYLHVRAAGTKIWKKRLCTLRSSGIYAIKKGNTELKCLTCLAGYYLFTTLGGWTSKGKIEAPTPHGFALKALQTHSLQSKQIHFFSATSELAMKRWCTALRVAMIGNQYYLSFEFARKSAEAK